MKKSQVQIRPENLDESKVVVEKILLTAATEFNLYDNSHTSRVPNTIGSIVEGNGFGFGLGARLVADSIVLDFMPDKNESPKFSEVRDYIVNELRNAFQTGLKEVFEDSSDYQKIY